MKRNWKEVEELAEIANIPDFKKPGGVTMLFDDGEVVYTKSGDLFGMRSFHQFEAPLIQIDDLDRPKFPLFPLGGTYRCIFVERTEDAREVRKEMIRVLKEENPNYKEPTFY